MKFLLVISKNYWGADKSVDTAVKFSNIFANYLNIQNDNIFKLMNDEVTVNNVKKILYEFIYNNLNDDIESKLYIYINGHGNQVQDINGDESIDIIEDQTSKDLLDEIYQLPDGNIIDDEITEIFIKAIKDKNKIYKDDKNIRPFICLISDHCSSGSMIDNFNNKENDVFDWISIGSSLDNQDSLMTGDGNVMTINLLNLLTKLYNERDNERYKMNNINAFDFNKMLQKEMKESFVGELQTATFHVSNKELLEYKIFQ